jgi:phospholipid transport system substrate-binding protein
MAATIKRWPARIVLLLMGSVLSAFLATGQAAADDGRKKAADFLTALSEEAIEKLADLSVGEEERTQRFQELMEASFDLPAIGKFVLGINWRRASPEQRQNFIDAFEDIQVQRFLPMFSDYGGEKLEIAKVRRDQNKSGLFFVHSKIKRPEAEPVFIEWRLRHRSDHYKILDVKAEGVSMALTLRAEYGEVVQNYGIDGLIDRLRKKAASGFADAGEGKLSQ